MAKYFTTGGAVNAPEVAEGETLAEVRNILTRSASAHIARQFGTFLVKDGKSGKLRPFNVKITFGKVY